MSYLPTHMDLNLTKAEMVQCGKRVREISKMVGSTPALAEMIECAPTAVRTWIRGERIPSAEMLLRLGKTTGVSTDWILGLPNAAQRIPEQCVDVAQMGAKHILPRPEEYPSFAARGYRTSETANMYIQLMIVAFNIIDMVRGQAWSDKYWELDEHLYAMQQKGLEIEKLIEEKGWA